MRILFGARQTGKTSLLRHALTGDHTRLFDLQDARLRQRFEADPAAFSREVEALPRRLTNVVVDEIQRVPALTRAMGRARTDHPRVVPGAAPSRQLLANKDRR